MSLKFVTLKPRISCLASFSRYATMRKFGAASFFCVGALNSSAWKNSQYFTT